MFKFVIFASIITTCYSGIIDQHYESHESPIETDHHSEIEHKHATSHQSFKIHHFHAVPTYVKKEDQEFLKHPVEVAGIKHKLKILHPETEHHSGHGLTLENHQDHEDKTLGHHSYDFGGHGGGDGGESHGHGGYEHGHH